MQKPENLLRDTLDHLVVNHLRTVRAEDIWRGDGEFRRSQDITQSRKGVVGEIRANVVYSVDDGN
jgi:hypothetical protein